MSQLMPYKRLIPADKKSTGNETAIDLIYNFLNEPALRGLSDLAIGGTFPLSSFQLGKESCAKQFWYCYDHSQAQPEVYLAVEDSKQEWPRNRKPSEIPTTPEANTLQRPVTPFTFDDQNFDRTDIAQVDRFLQQHKDGNRITKAINCADVKSFGNAFLENFGGKKENREFCYYPIAYFENFTPETSQYVIDDFLKIGDIHHVRYYFGLETSKGHGANRIRVVLFPIGKEQTRLQGKGGVNDVLQWSWPPDGDDLFFLDRSKKSRNNEHKSVEFFSEPHTAVVI